MEETVLPSLVLAGPWKVSNSRFVGPKVANLPQCVGSRCWRGMQDRHVTGGLSNDDGGAYSLVDLDGGNSGALTGT